MGFMALACLILWKKTFRGQTILAFLKAIAGVILLKRLVFDPLPGLYADPGYGDHHVSARTMQDKGLYPAQLFFAFFHRGNSRDLVENGLRNVEAMGVGITLITGLFLFVWLWFFKGKEAECVQEGSIKNTGKSKDTEKVRTARDVKDIWKSEEAGKAKKEEDVWKNKGLGNARSMRRNAELIKAGKLASVLGVLAMAMSLVCFSMDADPVFKFPYHGPCVQYTVSEQISHDCNTTSYICVRCGYIVAFTGKRGSWYLPNGEVCDRRSFGSAFNHIPFLYEPDQSRGRQPGFV